MTTLEHRQVALVWYWIVMVISDAGEVLAKVMDVDLRVAIQCANEALIESSIEL